MGTGSSWKSENSALINATCSSLSDKFSIRTPSPKVRPTWTKSLVTTSQCVYAVVHPEDLGAAEPSLFSVILWSRSISALGLGLGDISLAYQMDNQEKTGPSLYWNQRPGSPEQLQ